MLWSNLLAIPEMECNLSALFFQKLQRLTVMILQHSLTFPQKIRAPHNTVAGVSGYQVHIGKKRILTTGDYCDVLVAMNPASLKI